MTKQEYKKRTSRGFETALTVEQEKRLVTWIQQRKRIMMPLTEPGFRQGAREWVNNPNFTASRHWFTRFKERNPTVTFASVESTTSRRAQVIELWNQNCYFYLGKNRRRNPSAF